MTTPAWIGLGSNLGDRRSILDDAIKRLAGSPGVAIRAVSAYLETTPAGGPTGQGPFLNAAAHLETSLDARQLLATLQAIENQAGRIRTVRWGERTLDLDLLIFGTQFLDVSDLKLPHPRLALRRFVLAPLAEIAPAILDTMTRRSIADLLANLDRRPRLLAIDGRKGHRKSSVFRRLVEELPGFGISAEDQASPSASGSGRIEGDCEALERRAVALRAGDWIGETLQVPWIVADYSLGLDLLRCSNPTGWSGGVESEGVARMGAYRDWLRRARAAVEAALTPTFVLILPGGGIQGRVPGLLPVPQLWPESDQPAAIVEDALATCRSIEGV